MEGSYHVYHSALYLVDTQQLWLLIAFWWCLPVRVSVILIVVPLFLVFFGGWGIGLFHWFETLE
jgi:hypothetical protein